MKKLSLFILFLFLTGISHSFQTEIKINNLKKIYEEIINEIPLLRYIDSREGLGFSHYLNVFRKSLDISNDEIEKIINSEIFFYSNKGIKLDFFLNPNFLQILSEISTNSEVIVLDEIEIDTTKKLLDNLINFEHEDINFNNIFDIYNISNESSKTIISKNANFNYIVYENFDKEYFIEGRTVDLLDQNASWEFYSYVKDRLLITNFKSVNFINDYTQFDLSILEQKRIFGNYQEIYLIEKDEFKKYIQGYLNPFDEKSEDFIDSLLKTIVKDEFVLITSKSLTNKNIISFFINSNLDEKALNSIVNKKILDSGNIGNYVFYKITHDEYGDDIYLYYSDNDIILTTINPRNMSIYLSETQRFNNRPQFQDLQHHNKINKLIFIDLEEFFSKFFYSSVFSYITLEFYEIDEYFNINVYIR